MNRRDEAPPPPCVANPYPFGDVLDRKVGPDHWIAVAACKAICATCPLKTLEACLRENPDDPGVVGGLTLQERKTGQADSPTSSRAPSPIRAWAAENGHVLMARGPIRQTVLDAYKAAMSPDPTCGTEAGHKRHRRAGEVPCAPCKSAHAAGERERRAVRKRVAA